MRGGKVFWDFRSFNPPISKNNWANMYAEEYELRPVDNTIVVSNNYLDVPKDWLGEAFIEEAEELKNKNPRAYEHEYLGIPTGTGGDVFENVEYMDMSKPVVQYDLEGKPYKIPLWQTFDKIYNGIDWGFAKDPFRFVRMHFDVKKLDLYIFDEFSTMKMRNETVFRILYEEEKKLKPDDLVTADSAEEKSILDFKTYGARIRGAIKGPESVRYGIKWLQGLNHIYIDYKRCPETWKEFTQYEYEKDRSGEFISAYPDKDNHSIDACLTGNTEIYTVNGYYKIKDLVGMENKLYAYDIINKEVVEADFIHCRKTYDSADIYEIELVDGRIIECTYNHKILTSNRGYVMAGELTENDDIVCIY